VVLVSSRIVSGVDVSEGLSGIGRLDYWTGILEWPKLLLESSYSLNHFLHALFGILPRSLGGLHIKLPLNIEAIFSPL